MKLRGWVYKIKKSLKRVEGVGSVKERREKIYIN